MVMQAAVDAGKAAQNRRFPGTADVERLTQTPDDSGGMTAVWATVAGLENIGIRVMPGPSGNNAYDQEIIGRLGSRVPYNITLAADIPVTSNDRIHQLTPIDQEFEILAVVNADTDYRTGLRLVCAEWR